MLNSEYSFYLHRQAEKERLNRELELRRMVNERLLDGSAPLSRRTPSARRLAALFRRDSGWPRFLAIWGALSRGIRG